MPSSPTRRHRWSVSLREDFTRGTATPLRVDREQGVIHRVKIVGLESVNGMEGMPRVQRRVYTKDALARALGLYEGCHVSIDHPQKPGQQRSAYDRFGVLEHVELCSDGLYADLRYLKSHPLAERIVEAAERMPDAFGMSHAADAVGDVQGDAFVVTEITQVTSVDLVADPATTNGLFEGKQRMAATNEAMDYGTTATEAEEEGGWKHHLGEMIKSMVSDGEMDHDEMSAKVMHALKTMKKGEQEPEKTNEGDDLQDDAEHAAGDNPGPPSGKKAKNETTSEAVASLRHSKDPAVVALLERVDRLETKAKVQARLAHAHELCEAAQLPEVAVTDLFIESLVRAPDEATMKKLVEDRRKIAVASKPRSLGRGMGGTMDAKAFAAALRAAA